MARPLSQRWNELGPKGFARWLLQKRIGKGILRRLDRVMAEASLVGDPPLFDPALFPWTPELEARAPAIRKELDELLAARNTLPAIDEIQPDQTKIAGDRWKTFMFYGLGYRSERNCEQCPETAAALAAIPNMRTAWYSILSANAHIPRHSGITKGMIRCHLGLVVPQGPERCEMQVADEFVQWNEGKAIFFDDSAKHEVWNDSAEERVVLILDFERPMAWRGRVALAAMKTIMRVSPFMRDARRNQREWEARFYGAGSAAPPAAGSA